MGAYNSLIEQGFFVQGGPELAAYNQQQNEDNRKADEAMGGSKPKTLQDLIDSGIYGGMSLGPGASIAGSVLGKMFPTASDQDIIDYIIENKGLMPNTGRGVPLRDANGNVVLNAGGTPKFETHTSGPLKGLIVRAPGKDGEVKLSEAELAYLETVEDFKKANMKDGSLDYKGLRIDGLKSDIYKEGDGITGKFNLRSLSPTEIIEWYKTQTKKKPVDPVAATSTITKPKPATIIPDVTSADKPYVPPTRPAFEPDTNNPSIDGPLVDAGGLTQSERDEQNKQQDKETSAQGVADRLADRAKSPGGAAKSRRGFKAGGLIKKPKKKKTKKY
tara:strand:- start:6 stop:998 length:993 start_codon:yes stop_codon:yes gene_type:complete